MDAARSAAPRDPEATEVRETQRRYLCSRHRMAVVGGTEGLGAGVAAKRVVAAAAAWRCEKQERRLSFSSLSGGAGRCRRRLLFFPMAPGRKAHRRRRPVIHPRTPPRIPRGHARAQSKKKGYNVGSHRRAPSPPSSSGSCQYLFSSFFFFFSLFFPSHMPVCSLFWPRAPTGDLGRAKASGPQGKRGPDTRISSLRRQQLALSSPPAVCDDEALRPFSVALSRALTTTGCPLFSSFFVPSPILVPRARLRRRQHCRRS